MTADEAQKVLAGCAAALTELEAAMDLRGVPDEVLDALGTARAIATKYAAGDWYGDALASRRAPDPETEGRCRQ
jgi:hypothetical protein